MKKWFVLGIVMLMLVLPAALMAQDYPKAEVFGGYSYFHADGGINLNGWNFAVTGNANKWLGVTADFAGHYGDFSSHSYMFGPQVAFRNNDKIIPFVHALFGGDRQSVSGYSQSAFAMALGGGIDAKVADKVFVRIIQADYVMTTFGDSRHQNDARLSFGLVFHL